MAASFVLRAKDATTGSETSLGVLGEQSVLELKKQLVSAGCVPSGALRTHIAHNGRLLPDDALLETVRSSPVVVVAVVMPAPAAPASTVAAHKAAQQAGRQAADASSLPAAARPTPPSPPPRPPPPQPQQPEQPEQARQGVLPRLIPTRESIGAAWERAFPSGEARAAAEPERDDEPAERVCRVCYSGEEAGHLFSPCRCRGTMRWIHEGCLNEWRAASANPRSFTHCDQCGFRYRVRQTPLARWLQDERVVRAAAVAIFCALFLVGAVVPGRPERYFYRHAEWHPEWELRPWWGARCDACVRGLLVPAVLGFYGSVREAYLNHRRLQLDHQGWAFALVSSIAGSGGRIARPLLAGGLVYFGWRLLGEMRGVSRKLLTRFGEVVEDVGLA